MLCYQFSQVWIHYEVSQLFTCMSTSYILLDLPDVQEVIAAQRTTLALEKDMSAHTDWKQSAKDVKKLTLYCQTLIIFFYVSFSFYCTKASYQTIPSSSPHTKWLREELCVYVLYVFCTSTIKENQLYKLGHSFDKKADHRADPRHAGGFTSFI